MIIFLSLFLLINSVGVSVYAHYCGDNLQDTSIVVESNKSCCADEGEEESESMECCNEEHKLVKLEDEFLKVEKVELNHSIAQLHWIAINSIQLLQFNTISYADVFSPGKHLHKEIHRHNNKQVLFSVFRI